MASLLEMPLSAVLDTADAANRAKGFWESIEAWLFEQGLYQEFVGPDNPRLVGCYSIGMGPSPRGNFWHAVVCKSGKMVWDPHPSDDGLLEIKRHQLIFPIRKPEGTTGELHTAV
jgi:hypothetical protein